DEPLPSTTARLRDTLARAADDRLGLVVAEVDLEVTALLGAGPAAAAEQGVTQEQESQVAEEETTDSADSDGEGDGDEARVAKAALTVPGVARLTGVLGGLGRAAHIEDRPAAAALP
ncbi:nucleopolyhedrovirus P10 family protein, partial [Streptomyces sp. SID14478]|nr:nucleopolyhedrovirus P10 family protein [Streptomyces sp. SID14478]